MDSTTATKPDVSGETLSLLDLLFNGGIAGGIVISILLILLFIAMYIYFERFFAIKSASSYDKIFIQNITAEISKGNTEEAQKICVNTQTPFARITEKGISRIGNGNSLEDIRSTIQNAAELEVYQLEKNTSILATISGAAPMIGFLGTVIGMVLAFHQLATSSAQADMSLLAEGIYTAMTTTVAGLVVGIFAYLGYNHLVVKTDKVVNQMQQTATDFLDIIS